MVVCTKTCVDSRLMRIAKMMLKTFAVVAMILFALANASAEEELTFATRQIVNAGSWPGALEATGLVDAESLSMQSLTRIIYQQRQRKMRFRFAAELYGGFDSMGIGGSSGNWQTARGRSGYKAFRTDGHYRQNSRQTFGSEIEQLELSFGAGSVDFQVGRQPVSFGTSHYVSVLDVLAPFQPGYLDSSYKPGIDAIRMRTVSGTTGEIELIFAGAADSSDNAVFLRWRDTFSGFDFELLGGRFRQRKMFGIGWEGERRRVNLWGEAALYQRIAADQNFGGFSGTYAFSGIFGFEKETGKKWRHGLAFMHQDLGARSADNLMAVQGTLPFVQGWAHLGGADYLIANSSREISPLINLNFNTMLNLHDHSALYQPVLNISLSDESDIAFFAWLRSGRTPCHRAGQIQLKSEFASFPAGLGLIYRRYF